MKGELYILTGPAMSGKTTWARDMQQRFGDIIVRVEDDAGQAMIALGEDKVVLYETLRAPDLLLESLKQHARHIILFRRDRPLEVLQ